MASDRSGPGQSSRIIFFAPSPDEVAEHERDDQCVVELPGARVQSRLDGVAQPSLATFGGKRISTL